MFYMKVVMRVNPKIYHPREKYIFFFFLYLYDMMDVHKTYCDNHFMMYKSQIIKLYSLNLYSAMCQSYLNITGRKKEKVFNGFSLNVV